MKKTLITLLALSGIAMGETAGTTTLTPIKDATWTKREGGTLDATAGTLLNTTKWYIDDYTTVLENAIRLNTEGDSLTFSFDVKDTNALNFSAWVALENAHTAIVAGHSYTETTRGSMLASTTAANTTGGYDWANTNDSDETVLTAGATLAGAVTSGGTSKLTGKIAWSAKAGQFQLTLGDSTDPTATLNLGETVTISTLHIGVLGKASSTTLSNFSLTTTLDGVEPTVTPGDGVPEPTTATLSLLALAGLAARRRRR